ncbi:hypothetical protein J31TS4_37540 [Paenibacillus sp. J31TS4]|nr:hypothetical protein J31TS4_37540 [Paenibacillus sp. J31TS4]
MQETARAVLPSAAAYAGSVTPIWEWRFCRCALESCTRFRRRTPLPSGKGVLPFYACPLLLPQADASPI